MIIFLDNHPHRNEIIKSTDCMNSAKHIRTVKDAGSKMVYSDVFKITERRYWVSMTDNETGEIVTCEYELVDNTGIIVVS